MTNKSIKKTLTSFLILIGLLPTVLISTISIALLSRSLNDTVLPMTESNAENLASNFVLNVNNYISILNECASTDTVRGLAAYDSSNQNQEAYLQLNNVVAKTYYQQKIDYPFSYALYCNNGNVIASNQAVYIPKKAAQLRKNVESLSSFNTLMRLGTSTTAIGLTDNFITPTNTGKQLMVARNVLKNTKPVGIMMLCIDVYHFNSVLSHLNSIESSVVFVLDNKDNCVITSSPETFGNKVYLENIEYFIGTGRQGGRKTASFEHNGYVFNACPLSFQGISDTWTLLLLTPVTSLAYVRNRILMITLIIAVLVAIFVIFANKWLRKSLTDPIVDYNRFVNSLDYESLETEVTPSGRYEVLTLGNGLFGMVQRMRDNLQVIKDKEEEKRKLEMQNLTAQINPHFIRNTLNSIRLTAELSNAPVIAEQIHAFTRLIDYIFHAGEFTTVGESISYLDDYIKLQNLRYQNKFVFKKEIDERLMPMAIPGLIFQPIVENSIVHGLSKIKGIGTITMRGEIVGNDAVFTITDNGVGPGDDCAIGKEYAKPHGMTNIDRRLKLQYGENYGLKMEKAEERGAKVTIVLPCEKEGTNQL